MPRGMPLGFQGYYPRINPGPVSEERLLSPGSGTAWVGGCRPQELSGSRGVSLPQSLIIRTQGRFTVTPSRQRASHRGGRRETPLSPCLLQVYFWKRHKPGEVFGSIPSLKPLQQSPGAAATKRNGRNLPPFFPPLQSSSRHGRASLAGGCAGRSCSAEKPVSPACLCFLLS